MDTVISISTLLAFSIAAASPGPATMAVSTAAMAHGPRPAALFGLGLALGLAFWGVVAAAGLGAVLMQSTFALSALRWFGGAYLLFLAWQSARSALSPVHLAGSAPAHPPSGLLARGLLLNLSNPKAVMAWISVLALGLPEAQGGMALWLNTGLCAGVGVLIYLAYAIAFSRGAVRTGYRAARRLVDGVAAVFFGASGVKLLLARTDP